MKIELLKQIEEEQKLKSDNKLVRIKTIVRPKAVYKKAVKKFDIKPAESDYDPYTETGESTDTQTINRAVKQIKQIEQVQAKTIKPSMQKLILQNLF